MKVTGETNGVTTVIEYDYVEAEGAQPITMRYEFRTDDIEDIAKELMRLATAKANAERRIIYTEPEVIGVGVAPWAAERVLVIYEPSTDRQSAVVIEPSAAMKIARDIAKHVRLISTAAERVRGLIQPKKPIIMM